MEELKIIKISEEQIQKEATCIDGSCHCSN